MEEKIGREEMIAQNDEVSNEIDSHMRSADMEVASVNKFIDELHVSILSSFRHTLISEVTMSKQWIAIPPSFAVLATLIQTHRFSVWKDSENDISIAMLISFLPVTELIVLQGCQSCYMLSLAWLKQVEDLIKCT
jgi:hypothetical protein